MTAINHALTGAAIAFIVGNPLIAVPLAIASHFICDSLPHFGMNNEGERWTTSKSFKILLLIDGSLCIVLVALLTIFAPQHWLLAAICAFLATSPDLVWANRFFKVTKQKVWKPSIFSKFAGDIQWFERPIGSVVEVAWLIAGVTIVGIFV